MSPSMLFEFPSKSLALPLTTLAPKEIETLASFQAFLAQRMVRRPDREALEGRARLD